MDYLPLSKAASELKVSVDELIRRGADGEIDIYVIPSPAWTLKASGVQKLSFENGDEGGVLLEKELTGLAATLLRLKVAPLVLESYLHHPDETQAEGFVYTDPRTGSFIVLQPIMASPIYLCDCRLVVRDTDLQIPRKKLSRPKTGAVAVQDDVPEKPPIEVAHPNPTSKIVKTISPDQQLLRMSDLVTMTGLSKSSIYERIAQGTFPAKEATYGGRASFWRREIVQQWIDKKWQQPKDMA